MLLKIPGLLTNEQVHRCREALARASWVDGRTTAGHGAASVKQNLQLALSDPIGIEVGNLILDVLGRSPLFMSAALPLKVMPPMFNRYEGGGTYGNHVDNAIRMLRGTDHRVRTDISTTVFLTDPADYDGGELVIEDTYGSQTIKLAAGDMVMYPGTSVHRVTPVTRGSRISAFFWTQSLIREDAQRALLYELDNSIQQLAVDVPGHLEITRLTGVYHNLVRRWSIT
ncbi:Fe2+-dependent dioxygenase [Pigmentiphaga aceris]|uniref:Fe2+-dependent dioxygenase n=1 Tax=Pigmentiphaga aceris TaxID=1940612 RepID=A0A5C0B4L2_9BURK|nr:Fe2+-dependent dioxygenase [Pigmentiphaga aceris]QEI08190.1 Fe2+-dependent dioxygenase [Pigmentiphaga aceris]